jgi:hypothetical protein
MKVGKHRIITFGPPVGIGATASYYVTIQAVAKVNGAPAPYCVPNEIICAEIGRFLGLPVPPWGVVSAPNMADPHWFASLDFNLTGNALPPVDPQICFAQLPDLATGLFLFDTLIANSDRHNGNFSVDTLVNPPQMNVFDHSHALFGATAGAGQARLHDLINRLAVTGGSHTRGNRHCLIDVIANDKYFEKWLQRIQKMPDFFIEESCDSPVGMGIEGSDAHEAAAFLKHRRDNLKRIILADRSEFGAIQNWSLVA